METVVTHSGSFDPDDVLAVAALQLYRGKDNLNIIRSRDSDIIKKADWVIDVGGLYDPKNRRFDHHQNGVPKRDNGVPYSAFGLLWKECGETICGSKEVADKIENKLILAIDAADNHIVVCQSSLPEVQPVEFFDVIDAFKPVWGTGETFDSEFLKAVDFARNFLKRVIEHTKADLDMHKMIAETYNAAKEKSLLVFDDPIHRHALVDYEGVRVVVSPVHSSDVGGWMAAVVPVSRRGFQNRATFSAAWAGLVDEELEKVCHIDGAIFCHKERFVFVAKTKEAAIKAAREALLQP